MLQIGNKTIDTMYVGGKLVLKAYLGSKKVYPDDGVIPKGIKDAMVLWYDIKRQGATNESMAENPTLRDLSGNGHDATCYNFAWSGMSGVGRYPIVFHTPESGSGVEGTFENINSYTTIFTRCGNGSSAHVYTLGGNVPRVLNVRISGITGTGVLVKWDGGSYHNGVTIADTDGIWELSCDPEQPDGTSVGLKVYSDEQKDCNVTIELIPQYPNALVSDGVDDYAVATGIGLNSMKTIFVNMYLTSENREDSKFVFSSRIPGSEYSVALAYKVDIIAYNHRNSGNTYIDGTLNTTLKAQDLLDIKHIATLTNENGNSSISLDLFRNNINQNLWCNVVLYSFIAFNRILTPEEIKWVKTNLIETEQ